MALPMKLKYFRNLQKKASSFVLIQRRFLTPDDLADDPKRKKHVEEPQFPDEYSLDGPPKGKSYDKKPFSMELTAGKRYSWCSCGYSHTQPMCDGTHKTLWGTAEKKTMPKARPIRFQVDETKNYWLCNCKQTSKRPFCDGTHKRPDIQELKL
ncbi:CDGSH iron-sulfur domain-containing protein 3, mitochondrial-like [Gigantopelta aegis]|uniref:CDGSH iron-sulfur domain-containing protein 3, mitochondrial-like n=1 Tax=Gigantopelta aegis TaxID=1735272 RepID=UPI001B887ADB|nr:CDGSH iron-sulfur domain-containing protein 3, mitochondrial-like [Gigantopelta aegis]